jgi:hypothetical protein
MLVADFTATDMNFKREIARITTSLPILQPKQECVKPRRERRKAQHDHLKRIKATKK